MKDIKIELTGTPTVGQRKERTETFTIKNTRSTIQLKDNDGKIMVSFAPFLDGGSIWIQDFSHIVLDEDVWGERHGECKLLRTREYAVTTSTSEILRWKRDSEKLAKIREAQKLMREVVV